MAGGKRLDAVEASASAHSSCRSRDAKGVTVSGRVTRYMRCDGRGRRGSWEERARSGTGTVGGGTGGGADRRARATETGGGGRGPYGTLAWGSRDGLSSGARGSRRCRVAQVPGSRTGRGHQLHLRGGGPRSYPWEPPALDSYPSRPAATTASKPPCGPAGPLRQENRAGCVAGCPRDMTPSWAALTDVMTVIWCRNAAMRRPSPASSGLAS